MARVVMKKICLLGDGAVGKSSLIRRFVFDAFEEEYQPTIGTKIMKKVVPVPEKDVDIMFMIWDIMGHKSHTEIPPTYYQGTEGIIVVADFTREETLKNAEYWYKAPFEKPERMKAILAVNKADLTDGLEFDRDRVEEFAGNLGIKHYFTSAKTGDNVEEIFNQMAHMIAEKL